MIAAILSSRPVRWILGAGAAVLGFLGILAAARRDAAKDAITRAEIDDHENAADIRADVERMLSDELRKHEGAGWRDK
jgi:hypothetical protein